jgi:hypothetical protein
MRNRVAKGPARRKEFNLSGRLVQDLWSIIIADLKSPRTLGDRIPRPDDLANPLGNDSWLDLSNWSLAIKGVLCKAVSVR